jgi:hypothetical protein
MANTKIPGNDFYVGDNLIVGGATGVVYSGGAPVPQNAGDIFYVDVNAGVDTNDGLTWATAFKKLSVAMAASHASIAAGASGWAARNIIYFKGDITETDDGEDLTKLAQKTDVIGVGSTDWKSKPQIVGKHVIPSTTSYMGCRFINVMFKGTVLSGGDIFTLTSQHGIEFIGCEFMGDTTTAGTAAVMATACVGLKFDECNFKGGYTDAVIELGAGQADDFVVRNCFIQGANMGIDIPDTVTYAAGKNGLIENNIIKTTLACINDALGTTFIRRNNLFTAAAKGVDMAGAIVCGLAYAQDNRCTTSDVNNVVYPAQGSI